jgi:ribulose-phosphate 3-epimerase
VKALKKVARVPLDVHQMISEPDRYVDAFIEAGAAIVTVHAEAATHLHRTLTRIRQQGAKAGLALNPATPIHHAADVANDIDLLLVMSVNPGFGGQAFIPRTYDRIAEARELLKKAGNNADIEVDGGVDRTNAARLVRVGATVLVAGNSVFGTPDPASAARALREAALGAA